MDHFDESAFKRDLPTRWLGQHLYYREEVGSTNEWLKEQNKVGTAVLPTGALFLTDYQKQGRGRFERRWEAPAGSSLLFSLLLRPDWPAEQNGWLTMIASLSVANAIVSQTGLAAHIKWPNDVVLPISNDWYKVSGILLEGEVTPDGRCRQAILGIGINVNVPFGALPIGITPATSLLVASGGAVSRWALLVDLLVCLENLVDAALDGRSPQPAWQERLITLGQSVVVNHAAQGEELIGTAVGVDEWGYLQVQTEDGRVHSLAAADVTLRPKLF